MSQKYFQCVIQLWVSNLYVLHVPNQNIDCFLTCDNSWYDQTALCTQELCQCKQNLLIAM